MDPQSDSTDQELSQHPSASPPSSSLNPSGPHVPSSYRPPSNPPSRPPTANSSGWNGPPGWQLYFPNESESHPSCAGRSQVVSRLQSFFASPDGRALLSDLPLNSFGFPLDFRHMASLALNHPLRQIAKTLHQTPHIALPVLGLAATRAGDDLATNATNRMHHVQLEPSRDNCLWPRIRHFSPLTPLRDLRGLSVGTFIAVRGTVVRVSSIRQQLVSMRFTCGRCGEEQSVFFPDYKYNPPTSCPTDRCRSRNFTPLRTTAETVDWQRIRVQEIQARGDDIASFEQGRIPRTIDAEIFADLIDSCIPGDIATVCGIVKTMAIDAPAGPRGRGTQSLLYMYIEANSVVTNRNRDIVVTADGDDGAADAREAETLAVHRVIYEVLREKDPFGFLVHSAVPSIFGHELVKAGMLLALFGGSEKRRVGPDGSDSVAIRRDIHCLVVGDPGLGKSQMLKGMCNIAPRGVYVCGNTTSTAGLTVTVVREAGGDFALEAGALVLADGGVCCIDEFDKMGAEHGALLEAMEQQSVSVAKAGLLCNLSARTTVLAAANPVGGHYDRSRTVCENLKISLPLLSRFDLVFILMDRADAARDRFISEHVMRTFGMRRAERSTGEGWRQVPTREKETDNAHDDNNGAGTIAAATRVMAAATQAATGRGAEKSNGPTLSERLRKMRVQDPLPPRLFREYVAYARRHVQPRLCEGAKRVIQDFYLELRRAAKSEAADTTPVTTRQLESIIRLSEARARAVMRTVVTAADARDVIEIVRECMVAEMMDGGGQIDFGRASGMSRNAEAKQFVRRLQAEAQRRRNAVFNIASLKEVAKAMGMTDRERIDSMIDSLNTQGYLMMKGGRRYELQGSEFCGQTPRGDDDHVPGFGSGRGGREGRGGLRWGRRDGRRGRGMASGNALSFPANDDDFEKD